MLRSSVVLCCVYVVRMLSSCVVLCAVHVALRACLRAAYLMTGPSMPMDGAPRPRTLSIHSEPYSEPSGTQSLPVPSEKNVHSEISKRAGAGVDTPPPMQCCLVPEQLPKTESARFFRSRNVSADKHNPHQHCMDGGRGDACACKAECTFFSLGTDPERAMIG